MTKIIQRHDTAANWTSINPVLAAGEMGVETDTNKFKFGDGSSTWSELAYATSGSSGGGSGTQLTSADGTTEYGELALGDTLAVSNGVLNANLNELGNEVNNLSSRVTTNEDNITKLQDSKQDKLTAENGIVIKEIDPDRVPNEYLGFNKETLQINVPVNNPSNVLIPSNKMAYYQVLRNIDTTKAFSIEFSLPFIQATDFIGLGLRTESPVALTSPNLVYLYNYFVGYQSKTSTNIITFYLCRNKDNKRHEVSINFSDTPEKIYLKLIRPDSSTKVLQLLYKLNITDSWTSLFDYTDSASEFINQPSCSMGIGRFDQSSEPKQFDLTTVAFYYLPARDPYLSISSLVDNSTIKVNESGELYADKPLSTYLRKETPFPLNLTSNGTLGGSTPSCSGSTYESNPDHPYYYAFKGATSSTPSSELWGPGSGAAGQYLILDCVTPIVLQSFRWTNGGTDAERFPVIVFKGSNDNSNYTTLATYNTQNATDDSVTINNTTAYRYYKFEFPEAANWGKLGFISITGADGYDILNIGDGLEVTNNTVITAKPDNKYIRFNSNGELTTSTSVLTYGNFLDFCHNYPDEIKAALGLN